MAPVWMNAQQAIIRTSQGRDVKLAIRPASPVSESTAMSVTSAKPTYFEKAKSVWRPASPGTLTCSPSSCATHPQDEMLLSYENLSPLSNGLL